MNLLTNIKSLFKPTISTKALPAVSADTKPLKYSSGRNNPNLFKVIETVKDNSRKDIDNWRQALQFLQNPEEPKFTMFHDLIADLLTDGHLQSQIMIRKSATLNTDFHIINKDTAEINDELTDLFRQQWFFTLLDIMLDSIILGFRLVEFQRFEGKNITLNLVPPRHLVPTLGKFIPNLDNDQFIDFNNPNFDNWLLKIGNPEDLGIINNVVPNLIWLRNTLQSWADFSEKFGMPLITATTNSRDEKTLNEITNQLLELGETAAAAFGTGTDVKMLEASRQDAYNVYAKFILENANIISKQFVGSTMLSDMGSNRSQTEVHERTLNEKISPADKRKITFVVNNQLLPLLRKQGYNIPETNVFSFKQAKEELKLTEKWNITNGLISNGYEIDAEWISKTFDIPISKKTEKKNLVHNNNMSASLKNNIHVYDRYEFSCTCGEHVQALGGKIRLELKKLTAQLIDSVYNKKDVHGILGKLIASEGLELTLGLRNNFEITSEYTGPDLLTLQMMEYNVFEFAASKAEARLAAMKNLLVDSKTNQIRSFSEFKELCKKEVKRLNTNWLQTEYNLTIAVAQNSAQYLRFMKEKDTVTSFVKYQTAGDSKVRSSHKVLNGKVFNLSDKEAMDLFPPNGYGCRCEFVQHIGSKTNLIKGSDAKALLEDTDPKYNGSQFELNRADLKQVFTKKQFYTDIKGLPEKLNKMTFDKYGLEPYGKFKDKLKSLKIDHTITKENKDGLFKPLKDNPQKMGFEDYLGRKMVLNKKVFDTHTKGKYLEDSEIRHKLFPHVKEVLKNPSEVWFHDYFGDKKVFQTRYIKFFKDRALIVDTSMKGGELTIQTWHTMKENVEKQKRRGLRIKGKDL